MKRVLVSILIAIVMFSMGLSALAFEDFFTLPETPHTVVGDVNLDGNIDAADALQLLQFAVVKMDYFPDSQEDILKQQQKNYYYAYMRIVQDVNDDGKANAADALMILQYAVGKRTDFPRKDYSELQTLVKPNE